MKAIIILCGLFMFSAEGTSQNDTFEVEVGCSLGRVRGSVMTSRLGRRIYSFRGIRFGEPPVGDLRFRPPVPVKPWTDTFDASEEGPMCPQPRDPTRNDPISEDCLRLNVYTTKLPKHGSRVSRPVVVYFHPGGFYVFSGQSLLWGPQYIMDQDIVLVTVNYRLGSLGFISTGDSHAPGNVGFKDQVAALRFIQRNIESFGGDPNSVTITGCSAGAWSVSLHMVSPMSRGLFHRGIAVSGAATYQNPFPIHQKNLAVKQALFLNCPTDSSEKIISCLRTKSAEEMGNSLPRFAEWHGDPILVWSPVIEPEVHGMERFLHAQPVDLIRQGKFWKVPLIAGITKDEFGGVVAGPIEQARAGNTAVFDEWNANWTKIAPISYLYERDTPRSLAISEDLRQFYLNDQPVSLDNIDGISHLYADGVTIFGVHRLVQLIGQYSDKPVYYYKFSYQGRYSWTTWSDKKPFGVAHQDDLQYIFFISALFPYFEDDAPEIPTVEKLTSIWGNFARTGHPIPRNNPDFRGVSWTPFTPSNQAYMEINENFVMKRELYIDRMNEWEKLFPLKPIKGV